MQAPAALTARAGRAHARPAGVFAAPASRARAPAAAFPRRGASSAPRPSPVGPSLRRLPPTLPHAGGDDDGGGGPAPTFANSGAPRGPPTLGHRLLASLWYFVPAMDLSSLELPILRFVPAARVLLSIVIPGFDDVVALYYSSQFTPLIVFFAMFLAVVRNNRVHHFVRFHCMQAVTLDICVMLLTLLRSYFPMSFLWSPYLWVFDALAWSAAALPIFYSVFWALRGAYPDIKFVSESVYLQVEPSS